LSGGAVEALLLDMGKVILDVTQPAVEAFAAATGTAPDRISDAFADELEFFRAVAEVASDLMFDRDALDLIRDAHRAGLRVGVLSNDAYSILGRDFFADRPELAELDAFLDALDIGVRKPAPEAYRRAVDALGVRPERVVFLDDTPECVEGARAIGMCAVQVDPADRKPAFDRVRQLVGLSP
jgi:HAD superfamily hydrolase (TIGR01509 family)